jgi:hypothetical protein
MSLNLKHLLSKGLKIFTALFFILMCYYHLLSPAGSGDESLFINDLNYIKSDGWFSAIQKGIGLTYLLLVYPLSFLFSDFIALRALNVLLLAALFFYFYKWGAVKNKLFYSYLLFISTFGFFLAGTNDTLFIVAMVVFFNEVYKAIENKEKVNVPLMWCAFIVAFFTRELIYIYLPLVLLSIFLLWKNNTNVFHKWYIPLLLLIVMISVNIPSLEKNHHISYDNKNPDSSVKSTWVQRQYLAQLLVNQGKLANQSHPSWEQTDAYLLEHGENSLPKTTSEGILFDLKLTFLEFFKDFTTSVLLSIRITGMMLIFVFSYIIYVVFKRKITTNLWLPFSSFFVVTAFSFIIISYVETRWLMVSYIIATLFYSDLEIDKKITNRLLLLNHFILILVIFYGTYKVFMKL